jgi:hypothetical protein
MPWGGRRPDGHVTRRRGARGGVGRVGRASPFSQAPRERDDLGVRCEVELLFDQRLVDPRVPQRAAHVPRLGQ